MLGVAAQLVGHDGEIVDKLLFQRRVAPQDRVEVHTEVDRCSGRLLNFMRLTDGRFSIPLRFGDSSVVRVDALTIPDSWEFAISTWLTDFDYIFIRALPIGRPCTYRAFSIPSPGQRTNGILF